MGGGSRSPSPRKENEVPDDTGDPDNQDTVTKQGWIEHFNKTGEGGERASRENMKFDDKKSFACTKREGGGHTTPGSAIAKTSVSEYIMILLDPLHESRQYCPFLVLFM